MKKGISASMMCADFFQLSQQLSSLENSQVAYLHMDIMDGDFVPNIVLGSDFVNKVAAKSKIPVDIHLMVHKPMDKIKYFNIGPESCITVHYESCECPREVLQQIKSQNIQAGIAYSPDTPLDSLPGLLDLVDLVLIMGVYPGFAGQQLVDGTLIRLKEAHTIIKQASADVRLSIDGCVSVENGIKMAQHGADVFVLGTSALFLKNTSIEDAAARFRQFVLKKVED